MADKLMNKIGLVVVAAVFFGSTQLQADVPLGLELGSSIWKPDYTGSIALAGPAIDIANDLGFDNESHSDLWLRYEHPMPLLPNIKAVLSNLDATTSAILVSDIDYGGQVFNANDAVTTQFDMTNSELTLYYELLDNWINLDAGFTLRRYDGRSQISSTNAGTAGEDLDFSIPLLYLDARIDLPFTGFFLDSTMNTMSVDDNAISDINVSLGYESDFGLGATFGYRTLALEFDESDVDADLEFEGTYLNLLYHF